MMTTRKLRLGPLPKSESTKLTFACPASLKADLDRYAALHAQTYGEAVDAATLIPHMLETIMAGDRGFRKSMVTPIFATLSLDADVGLRKSIRRRRGEWLPAPR
ncbi:hypothetical protein CNE_BB1p04820 (plasmid) [Cupriavidus necator N-1]|uniref:DUF2274 domain-containing protein n=1 Tax=Cupriavidus necator (strain ATCC 43291 / DSM 13513 / CCUG 52238 / LMG 8453 / N-1) TaxID=1042878 RepID=F8GX36_CUPNN|nr:DUF2274 domain-containing protein [Cupriavidus necator]AEI81906.1 hypothetical protein CNE_BB1p04820 [Cupriavidus necator N-1]MDX6008232.1 DUF2274 domain-containing protein [Cupriavidus necator]